MSTSGITGAMASTHLSDRAEGALDAGIQAAGAVDGADNQGLRPDAAVDKVINTVVFNEELTQYNELKIGVGYVAS
jgi:hypothetical protein